jgi:hypothetical protein
MKPGAPLLQSARLLDQVHERVRYLHYSLKTEKAHLYGVRLFIRWSAAQSGVMRHPCEMGGFIHPRLQGLLRIWISIPKGSQVSDGCDVHERSLLPNWDQSTMGDSNQKISLVPQRLDGV